MTRINCVPAKTLTDKHLLAEYKEITRPFNKVIKRIEAGTIDNVVIPKKYCLGKGHETFFFDKLRWLCQRYVNIFFELTERGFKLDREKFYEIHSSFKDLLTNKKCWNDWEPTPEDMYLNMARLAKRSNLNNVLEELNNHNN